MSDQILNLTGQEIELHVLRGTDNTITAALQDADGNVVDLSASDVIFVVMDRDTLKHTQTNTPGDHADAAGGVTRFNLPRTAYEGLTGRRPYTWKYEVIRRVVATGALHPFFHGDLRILPRPSTPSAPMVNTVSETIGVTDEATPTV